MPAGAAGRGRVAVCFSQVQARSIEAFVGDDFLPVARVTVDDADYISTEESVLQERRFEFDPQCQGSERFAIAVPGGLETDTIFDAAGNVRGRVVRERWPLHASAIVQSERIGDGIVLRVTLENESDVPAGADRAVAHRTSLVSTNVVLGVGSGAIKGEIP